MYLVLHNIVNCSSDTSLDISSPLIYEANLERSFLLTKIFLVQKVLLSKTNSQLSLVLIYRMFQRPLKLFHCRDYFID